MITLKCQACGKPFLAKNCHRNYRKNCSKKCFYSTKKGKPSRPRLGFYKNCIICNKSFYVNKMSKRKYCSSHCYWKDLKGKYAGKKHPQWTGGKSINHYGYMVIKSPNHPNKTANNSVLKHRLVAEKHLGRYLTLQEVVHHINDKKLDNRPMNLYVFTNKSKHTIFHRKVNSNKVLLNSLKSNIIQRVDSLSCSVSVR